MDHAEANQCNASNTHSRGHDGMWVQTGAPGRQPTAARIRQQQAVCDSTRRANAAPSLCGWDHVSQRDINKGTASSCQCYSRQGVGVQAALRVT